MRWRSLNLAHFWLVWLVGRLGVGALFLLTLVASSPPPLRGHAKAINVTRIHVSKSERTMDLYDGTTLVASYAVAVGRGGAGYKKMEGDNVTPVGHYHVVTRVPSRLRVFMRLDYPNADDRARFEELRRRGELPKNATMGGEIGIHGEPPEVKPFNKFDYGSHGCVVLENAEIDEVSHMVPDGTPVDIDD
jgi:murein L,D-transpeptidase YafK